PTIGWQRRGHTLALLPTTQFPGSSFDVYYEIYNLPYGTPYSTEIAIEKAGGERESSAFRPVTIRFEGESDAHSDAVVSELRRVETALPSGRYRITVTVANQITRESASRSRSFAVNRDRRSTTLPPAWPHVESPPAVRPQPDEFGSSRPHRSALRRRCSGSRLRSPSFQLKLSQPVRPLTCHGPAPGRTGRIPRLHGGPLTPDTRRTGARPASNGESHRRMLLS